MDLLLICIFTIYLVTKGADFNTLNEIYPDPILNDHEIVYPDLHFTNHERLKRNSEDVKSKEFPRTMNVNFNALGKDFNMKLDVNNKLLSPNFHIETLDSRGRILHQHKLDNCFYTGHLKGANKSLASLSYCDGLKGVIQLEREKYYIQPIQTSRVDYDDNGKMTTRHAHIVKRMSADEVDDMLEYVDQVLGPKKRHLNSDNSCGIDDSSPHVRWRRGIQSERLGEQTIEAMLTLDRQVVQFYGVDAAKEYALSVANVAHNVLRDSTIGPNTMNLVVNKLVILTSQMPDLSINHHARNTLSSFGQWADRRNKIDENGDDQYDYAVLFTKHDICADRDQPCEARGLTYIGGMCDSDRSSAIIEVDGFNTAFSLAHQIGHSLGMDHDGVGNSCEESRNVMSINGGSSADAYHWSHCSVDYLQQFLRKNQSKCLMNEPSKVKRENIELYENIGNVYDTDSQCRFALGEDAKSCYQADKDEICAELMCVDPRFNNCTRMYKPSMDGTNCGKNLWCKHGVCVLKGIRDDLIIDGGWGEWKEYPHCTRTCGGGVNYRERICDNPGPKHGGKYCEGESRQYEICNKQPCNGTIKSFHQLQCEQQNNAFFGDARISWTSKFIAPDSSCNLRCESVGDSKITKFFGHVMDGTDCSVANIAGRCVQGECNPVGCDMEMGSLQVEDRCGICAGNGTSCAKDLKENSVVISRNEISNDMIQRLTVLEEQKNAQVQNIAKRLVQLRAIMKEVVATKCGGNQICIQNFSRTKDITKKDQMEAPPRRFYWTSISSGCSVSCGSGSETLQAECRRIDDGSTVSPLFCENADKPNIIIKSCQRPSCPPRWTASKWTPCTRSCGSGRKTRNLYCSLNVGKEEYILPSNQCKESEKPLQLMICNHEPCPPDWYTEPFGECSTKCGVGRRSRAVVCRQLDHTDGIMRNLNDSSCGGSIKPETSLVCNAHNPCPGEKCGGRYTSSSGRITSPNFPGNYSNDMECVHEISAPKNQQIRLQFERFNIAPSRSRFSDNDCGSDFLRIVDGKCSEASFKPIEKLCGYELPSMYLSSGNNLCMKFVSDESVVGTGFALNYTSQNPQKKDGIQRFAVRDICDLQEKVVSASLGVVTSPNYPANYPPNENCKVTFNSDGATQGYMLKFDGMHIGERSRIMDCELDYLEVMYSDQNERICGSEESIPTINIPANRFSISFHSSPFSLNKKGFVFTFVTKKYARDYALDNTTALNIQNYTTTLEDWRKQMAPAVTTQPENEITESVSDLKKKKKKKKKSLISSHSSLKDKQHLMQAVLQLASNNPERLGNLLHEVNIINPNNNMKKSFIPLTNHYFPTSYNQWSNYPSNNYNIRRNFRPNDVIVGNFPSNDVMSADDMSMFGESRNSHLSYNNRRSFLWNPQQQITPHPFEKDQSTSYTFKKDRQIRYNPTWYYGTEFFPSNQVPKSVLPSPSYHDDYRRHEIKHFSEQLNPSSEQLNPFQENSVQETFLDRNWIAGGNIPLSKLKPEMFGKSTMRRSFMETWKDKVRGVSVYPSEKRKNVPVVGQNKHLQKVSSAAISRSNVFDKRTRPNYFRSFQSNFPREISLNSWSSFYRPTWNRFARPDSFEFKRNRMQWSNVLHWQPSYRRFNNIQTEAVKRQYQSVPFTYFPNFGMLNNHCPPTSSLNCGDIIHHRRCFTSSDCYGMTCCETDCPHFTGVCTT